MEKDLKVHNPQIFTGYSHIGSCREFVWTPGEGPTPPSFTIHGLQCDYDVESLMIRKDLFLQGDSGEEFLIRDFRLTDIMDIQKIRGTARSCTRTTGGFPENKSVIRGEKPLVSTSTQIMAIRAVSSLINSVHSKDGIDERETGEVVEQLISEVAKNHDAIMNLIAVKSFDDYTFSHNINVATLSVMIGQEMNLPVPMLRVLGLGAILHDIGKLRISATILNKIGTLTDEEILQVRRHPEIGYKLLEPSKTIDERSRLIVLQHHEKFRGLGYPKGERGSGISLLARIVAIADVYDALTTDRPFRPAMLPYQSTRFLLAGVDSHFDPEILQVFIRKMSIFPPGSLVLLNDGTRAAVLRTNSGALLRPVVKRIRKAENGNAGWEPELDLLLEKNLFIVGPADV